MRAFEDYADFRVRFRYPEEYKLKATKASGQYYLRRSKDSILSISILPKGMAASAFNSMVLTPAPADRRCVVCENYTLGGKHGRAIACEILNARNRVIMKNVIFLFVSGKWDVFAELYTRPPADAQDLEEIIGSLQVISDVSQT